MSDDTNTWQSAMARRRFLAGSGLAVGATLLGLPAFAQAQSVPPVALQPAGEGWASLAPGHLRVGGSIFPYGQQESIADALGLSASERSIVSRDFDAATLSMYMPWGDVYREGSNGRPIEINWEPYNRFATYAQDQSLWVHGHVLLYPLANESSNLDWLRALPADQMRTVLQRYVQLVAAGTNNLVAVWDVVNEVFGDRGNDVDGRGLRTQYAEYQKLGDNYVREAFEWARQANDRSDLIINDYGAEEINEKSDALFEFVVSERRRGTPIDGVGFQCHFSAFADQYRSTPDFASIRRNFGRFADAGFDVYITELDVLAVPFGAETDVPTTDQLEAQAAVYRELAAIAVEDDRIKSYLLWDFVDHNSWLHPVRSSSWAGRPTGTYWFPTPFAGGASGNDASPKPAYAAVAAALAGGSESEPPEPPMSTVPTLARVSSDWQSSTSYLARAGTAEQAASDIYVGSLTPEWWSMQWIFETVDDGSFYIRCRWDEDSGYLSRRSRRLLDGTRQSTSLVGVTPLQARSRHQRWRVDPHAGGTYIITNLAQADLALTRRAGPGADGRWEPTNELRLTTNRGIASQRWTLDPV